MESEWGRKAKSQKNIQPCLYVKQIEAFWRETTIEKSVLKKNHCSAFESWNGGGDWGSEQCRDFYSPVFIKKRKQEKNMLDT